VLIHLDTDIGGDIDDACALAMLLGLDDVELVGLTTNLDAGGLRAGMAAHYLSLAGRDAIPVAAGAGCSLSTLERHEPCTGPRSWDVVPPARPSRPGAALDLIAANAERGATLVAIGALTNLALLEVANPGALARCRVVVMGGYLDPPAAGLPAFRPEHDWNVQNDTRAAEIVFAAAGELVLAPLPVCEAAHLRERDLPRLAASSPLGALIARQAAVWAQEQGEAARGRAHAALPDDLVNFQWDPLTAALAAGFAHVELEDVQLGFEMAGATLLMDRVEGGRPATALRSFDAAAFEEYFLDAAGRATT
jgi:inosine-uridine nucleoside N-ribohydrolase